MKYPDIEKRLRKLEKRITDGRGMVHVAYVHPGEDRDEKVAALGPIPLGDDLIVVNFVLAADVRPSQALQ